MFTRQASKSDIYRVLQDMDFGRLEQSARLQMEGMLIHDSIVDIKSPTARNNDHADAYAAMLKTMQDTLYGMGISSPIWRDDIYISPEPHCQKLAYDIIDKFWAYPGEGHMYLYLEQLRKNPLTRDLFKSKSTTHHFPWYRRGSKY